MPQQVEFVLDAKEAGAVRAWLAVQRAADQFNASLQKTGDIQEQSKKAEAELAKLRSNGLSLLKMIETEEQKYARLLAETEDLQKKGALSAQEAGKIIEELSRKKFAASEAGKAQAKAEADAAAKAAAEEVAAKKLAADRLKKLEEEHARQVKESERIESERAALARRWLAEIQTPQQRYNDKVKELNSLKKEGRINEEQYAAAVKKTKGELESSTVAQKGWLDSAGAKLGAAAAGYLTVSAAVSGIDRALTAVMESNRKFIEQAEDAGAKYDKLFRQFRIQAGLGAVQGDAAKKRILGVAEAAGFTEERATSAATALVSAGVDPEQASGGALSSFLAMLNAQGLRDSDPSQYADALTAVLQSNQMPVDEANMRKLGVQLQSAPIKATKLKLTQLPKLATVSSGLAGAMTQEEQLAAFAIGGSASGNFDQFGTSMADIIKNLRIAATKQDAVEYLGKIGLKPEQVDFVGEDFSTVMGTLGGALDKAPEELRAQVLAKVIEGGNISNFNLMRNNLGAIMETSRTMGGADAEALFRNDVAVGSGGIDATRTRQALRQNRTMETKNTNTSLLRNELAQLSLDRGDSPIARDMQLGYFDWIKYTGYDDQTALDLGAAAGSAFREFGISSGKRDLQDARKETSVLDRIQYESGIESQRAVIGLFQRMASSLDQQTRIAEEQKNLAAKQNQLIEGGGLPPVKGPRPLLPVQANDIRFKGQFLPPGDRP